MTKWKNEKKSKGCMVTRGILILDNRHIAWDGGKKEISTTI